MSSFTLTSDTDRAALIAALKERGIEAFRMGTSTDACALAGGNTDVIACQRGSSVRFSIIGEPFPKNMHDYAFGLEASTLWFAALFGYCEQGDAGRYAANAKGVVA